MTNLTGFIGTPLLSVVYLIGISLLFYNKKGKPIIYIANAGRMGLTNYLMQTVICMALFYGYGLGLSGKLTLMEASAVAIGIYFFQLVYNSIWLNYHPMGPMEKIWRKLTYGKMV